jgi:hypothetical protein
VRGHYGDETTNFAQSILGRHVNIEILRSKIAAGNYQLTQHAKDEAASDELDIDDIEFIVLSGRLAKILTRDSRGRRYLIAGLTADKDQDGWSAEFFRPGSSGLSRYFSKGEKHEI